MRYGNATISGDGVYNKLFTKILDSTVWLESDATRLVWITMLAAMDKDGFVALSGPANVAHRARIPLPATEQALARLEGTDEFNPNQENGGRRIERVEDGWLVLNAPRYRDLVTADVVREQTRIRVKRFREKNLLRSGNASNAETLNVTQSDTVTDTTTEASTGTIPSSPSPQPELSSQSSPSQAASKSPRRVRQEGGKWSKTVPEGWQPGENLVRRIAEEQVEACLERGGTTLAMEIERFRSCTFSTPRSDWDRAAWHWLMTECKRINERETRDDRNREAQKHRRRG